MLLLLLYVPTNLRHYFIGLWACLCQVLCHSAQTFSLLLSLDASLSKLLLPNRHPFSPPARHLLSLILLVKTTINLIVLQNICCHNVGILSGASCDSFDRESILFSLCSGRAIFCSFVAKVEIDFDLHLMEQ